MKKLIALFLALMAVFALCACGESEETDNGGNTQMVNPMVESTPEDIESAIGVALTPPEGANDTMYFIIGGNMGEVQFKYGKTNEKYSYRVQKTGEAQDISGLYFSSPIMNNVDFDFIPPLTVTIEADNSMGAATWYCDGYSYSISMGEGASLETLENIYELVYSGE